MTNDPDDVYSEEEDADSLFSAPGWRPSFEAGYRSVIAAATPLSAQNGVDRATVEKCIEELAKVKPDGSALTTLLDARNRLLALLPVETEGKP